MSFETPVQPVIPRRRPGATALLIVALLLAALVVSRPWGGNGPSDVQRAAIPASPAASARSTSPPVASNSPSAAPTSTLYGDPPSADQFLATWSVVGVREAADGGYSIAQEPLEPAATPRTGMLAATACDGAPAPDVGLLPDSTLRLLGVVAPHAGHGWIRLSLSDGSVARAFAVIVSYPPGTEDLAVGLFGVSAYSLWPRGGYRFYAVDDAGTGRYPYACLGG